jgi:tetratricopeptide (TPR) repeat protein
MVVGVVLAGLIALALIVIGFIVSWVKWQRQGPVPQRSSVPATKKWVFAAGVVAVLLCAAAVIYLVQSVAQPVVSCSPVKGVSSRPPAALVTARDFFALGNYEYDQGSCDGAIAAYGRAIELDPNFAEAYNNRAYSYMVKQDYAAALPDLDRAIQLRPNYVNALMNRGDIYNYYYNIDRPRAIADYDRVLQLVPGQESNTSVCGHRLLAVHNGWSPGVFLDLVTQGVAAGCSPANKAN